MRGTLIILGIIGCALARPDIGLQLREQGGYHFQPPATSYGVPSGSYLPPNLAGSSGEHHHHGQSLGGGASGSNGGGNFASGSNGGGNFASGSFGSGVYDISQGGSSGHEHHGGSGHGHHGGSGHDHGSGQYGSTGSSFVSQDVSSHASSTFGSGGGGGGFSGATGGGGFSGGTGGGGFSGFQGSSLSSSSQAQSGTAEIQKHVYFFDAPEDEQAPPLRIHYQQANAKKNYRVIFIKAPSYKAPKIPEIAVQNQDQEKTVVYVLVKKQDEAQDIVIPTSAPSKPSKPDVYFIKYKTKQEAEQKIQSIQQGGSSGVSANAVGSDADFVSTIHEDSHSAGGASSGFDGHNHDHHNQIIHSSTYPSHGQHESTHIQGGSAFPSQGSAGTGHYGNTQFSGGNTIHLSGHPHGQENAGSGTHISQSTTSGYNYGPAGQSGPYKKREIKV